MTHDEQLTLALTPGAAQAVTDGPPADPIDRVLTLTAKAEIERLRAELERERMRLVACSVAAIQNTRKSARDRITSESWAWSASYGDICRAVDREITERERAERAEAELLAHKIRPRGKSELPNMVVLLAKRDAALRAERDALRHDLERLTATSAELAAERDALLVHLRQHAISHDPTTRPMWSTCNICEAQWGGEDAESHGPGCPFYIDAARKP